MREPAQYGLLAAARSDQFELPFKDVGVAGGPWQAHHSEDFGVNLFHDDLGAAIWVERKRQEAGDDGRIVGQDTMKALTVV